MSSKKAVMTELQEKRKALALRRELAALIEARRVKADEDERWLAKMDERNEAVLAAIHDYEHAA
jgi:hypothetical protein